MNKNRFKELLGSTMGDVRPLVSEQNEFNFPPPEGKILVKDKDGKERYVDNEQDDVEDLKKELMSQLKFEIQRLESDNDADLCNCLTRLHFALTNVYENPNLRNKGWNPENCTNFSQLDMLMKND